MRGLRRAPAQQGQHPVVFLTLYGDVQIASPRLYLLSVPKHGRSGHSFAVTQPTP